MAVYSISYNDTILYIGSSKNYKKRWMGHKSNCYNANSDKYNYPLYEFIRETEIDWDDLVFKVEEEMDFYDKELLQELEDSYLRLYPTVCNHNKVIRTIEDKTEYMKDYMRTYRKYNGKLGCECGGEYRVGEMKRHNRTVKHQTYINQTTD